MIEGDPAQSPVYAIKKVLNFRTFFVTPTGFKPVTF